MPSLSPEGAATSSNQPQSRDSSRSHTTQLDLTPGCRLAPIIDTSRHTTPLTRSSRAPGMPGRAAPGAGTRGKMSSEPPGTGRAAATPRRGRILIRARCSDKLLRSRSGPDYYRRGRQRLAEPGLARCIRASAGRHNCTNDRVPGSGHCGGAGRNDSGSRAVQTGNGWARAMVSAASKWIIRRGTDTAASRENRSQTTWRLERSEALA
jgi:hypothetical protein